MVVDEENPILVALGALDSPLFEIKISKLKKQHISETVYCKIFCWNLFNDGTMTRYFFRLLLHRHVTRGGGEVSPALFRNLEKSALILGKNVLIIVIYG